MSRGTIIYIGGFELPDKNAAAHRVLNNGKILKKLGYNVIFIDVDKDLLYGNNILNTKKDIQGFECWSIPYPQSQGQWIHYLSNIDSFVEILNQYQNVKAVIAYNYQAIALLRLRRHCNKIGVKIISDCSEWYNTKGSSIIFKIIKGLDSFLRMRIIQKRLDGLIVISRYLEKYYGTCSNVIRIPPLVDLSEEKWNTEVTLNDINTINFVYAGSPGKNKDKINLFIEALYNMEGYSNYQVNIIGVTKEQYITDFIEQKQILEELGNKIVFHGRLSHEDSLKYVRMADFSVLFREENRTTKAGFPTKFVESISSGTPVITTKNSDLEDYIIEGENGFFINTNNLIMEEVLKIKRKKIEEMKKKCKIKNPFIYQDYISLVDNFMKRVEK